MLVEEVVHRLYVAENVGCKRVKTSVGDGIEDNEQMVVANSFGISGYLAIHRLGAAQERRDFFVHVGRGWYGGGDEVGDLGVNVVCGRKMCLEWGHFRVGETARDSRLRKKVHGNADVEVERFLKRNVG